VPATMKSRRLTNLLALTVLCLVPMTSKSETLDPRGIQFIPLHSFSNFKETPGENPRETVLTSPEIRARISWNELIASWNAETPTNAYLRIEARAISTNRTTKWYVMGLWSGDPARHPRESVRKQKDADGDVDTDTLILKTSAERVQLRVTLGGEGNEKAKLKF